MSSTFGQPFNPKLKAINVGTNEDPIYYPREYLRIMPCQIYKRLLPDTLVDGMLGRATCSAGRCLLFYGEIMLSQFSRCNIFLMFLGLLLRAVSRASLKRCLQYLTRASRACPGLLGYPVPTQLITNGVKLLLALFDQLHLGCALLGLWMLWAERPNSLLQYLHL
jgi:hypothetical protein